MAKACRGKSGCSASPRPARSAAGALLAFGPNQEDVRAALGRAWDSVANRLGQLVYDNLFWNKVLKDLAMGAVRSVGWDVALPREVPGGADSFNQATGECDFTPRMS